MVKLNESTVGYEASPGSGRAEPGVLVIHEIVGLVDYIKEVTRSLAENGYLGLAVDLYGGKIAKGFEDGRLLRDDVTEKVFKAKIGAAIHYLKSSSRCTGRVGVVGFCMGGGLALRAACLFPQDINACSIFYGRIEKLELLKNLQAPVLGNFAEEDKRITTWVVEEFRPEMQKLGKDLDMKIYPGAQHAFHNDTIPQWYHPDAARDAWNRTLEFFKEQLKV